MSIPGSWLIKRQARRFPSRLKGPLDDRLLMRIDRLSRLAIEDQDKILQYTNEILQQCSRHLYLFTPFIEKMGDKSHLTLGTKRYWSLRHKRYWHISLFRFNKGESHPFHLHENICAFHLTVKGVLRSYEYDVGGHRHGWPGWYVLTGGYRREDVQGEGYATTLDHRNAHWFDALEDDTYFLIYSLRGVHQGSKGPARRVYLMPVIGRMGDKEITAVSTDDRDEAMLDGPG